MKIISKRFLMRVLIGVMFISTCVGGCSYFNNRFGLQDDHLLEEMVEEHIKNQTGLDIDLTPESEE